MADAPQRPVKSSGPMSMRMPVQQASTRAQLQLFGRTLLVCMLVGLVVGLGACLFHVMLSSMHALVMDGLVHENAPRPYGEPAIELRNMGDLRRWLLLIVPAIGGLLCGLIVHRFAPEAAGGGGDAMLDAYHNKRGVIRGRVPIIKAIASMLIIGTGGSAGREGPIMQIGAGFGSWVARILNSSDRTRRLLLLAGTAAGMAALFRTPLGAAIFAIEVLYRDDFEAEGIVPAVIASVTAYSVFITVFGQGSHLFRTAPSYPFSVTTLPLYLVMALVLVAGGKLFTRIMHGSKKRLWDRWAIKPWLKPAVGGLMVGAIACALPQVSGMGYGWLQDAILWTGAFELGWGTVALLLVIALAKMVATSCTISSGGSGGDFGPSLVIGGMLGGACGQAFHLLFPGLQAQPGAFALVGMATFFGGIAHVPLASLIMVCELTGTYDLLVPLMLCEGVAFALNRRTSLYTKQFNSPVDSPAHAGELVVDLLASLRVENAYDHQRQVKAVQATTPLGELLTQVSSSRHATFPVCDAEGRLVGMVSLATLRGMLGEALDGAHAIVAGDAMEKLVTVAPEDSLSIALDRLLASGHAELPVAESLTGKLLGLVGHADIVSAYHRELARRRHNAATG
jgi:chloride channel protein, CIC family